MDSDSDDECDPRPAVPVVPPTIRSYTNAPENKRKWNSIMLVNVVVTGSTRCALDLHNLSKKLLNAEYFPKKFAALKLCRTHPFAKALVFRSGKIVCVGATSIERAFDSLDWFVEQIKSIQGSTIQVYEKTVQNMVASTSLKDDSISVNLQKVFDNCPSYCQFEPELFPGLSFRQDMNKQGVLNLFGTGKCVLTGLKSMEAIPEMFNNFMNIAVTEQIFW